MKQCIGVTGTQSPGAKAYELATLALIPYRGATIINGLCVGMDEIVATVCKQIGGFELIGVMPANRIKVSNRAYRLCDQVVVMPAGTSYMDRNDKIIQLSTGRILLAFPHTAQEELRSGTWATVRRARKAGFAIVAIHPVGGN